MRTKYNREEVKVWSSRTRKDSWPVDGYVKSDNGVKIYEFRGDHWHKGCPHCRKGTTDQSWVEKKSDIGQQGFNLEVMWECQFDKLLPQLANSTPETSITDILKTKQTEFDLLEGVASGRLYGFMICDVESPPSVVKEMASFPPIIKRMTVTDEHLSEYTKSRVYAESPNRRKFERETLVQCFNAKEHLLLTSLAQYYMSKGIKISNVTRFIQFVPRKCLSPFVKHVTKMRIDSEMNGETTKGNTAKIYGNSGYGKVRIILCNIHYEFNLAGRAG